MKELAVERALALLAPWVGELGIHLSCCWKESSLNSWQFFGRILDSGDVIVTDCF